MEMITTAISRYCSYQERCHEEVRRKLYELGCNREEVAQYMAELIENDLLNEERFARAFARGRFRMKGWGRIKLKYELKARKVSEYCIRKGLEEIAEEEYEAALRTLVMRKLRELGENMPEMVLKQRVLRYLAQKGYETDRVIDIINDFQKR